MIFFNLYVCAFVYVYMYIYAQYNDTFFTLYDESAQSNISRNFAVILFSTERLSDYKFHNC